MSRYKVVKFKNLSPIHIGKGRESYDVAASGFLQSDTISAALAALRAQRGKTDVESFLNSFTISSAFPFDGDLLFLPKANGKLNVIVPNKEENEYRKQLKKIEFVALPLWTRLANGEQLQVECSQLQGEYLVDKPVDDYDSPSKRVLHQRVLVPRMDGEDARPFSFEWQFFRKDAGLYCILSMNDEAQFAELLDLFKELGEQGVGSDRNIGGGHFDVEVDEILLPEVAKANAVLSLSLYLPTEAELEQLALDNSKYQLVRRGGYMAGSSNDVAKRFRKNTVHMFTVGSVFATQTVPEGKVVELTPPIANAMSLHPVYRSGRSLFVKVNTAL